MTALPADDGLLVQLANQKKLFLSNEILLQNATAPLLLLETVRARGLNAPLWRRRVEKERIEIFESSGGVAATREVSIAAQLDVPCHLMEVHNALIADASHVHEAMLRGLYSKRFRRGAVLHTFDAVEPSRPSEDTGDATTGDSDEDEIGVVAVKSASFAASKLAKELDFYYVDYRTRLPDRKAVVHITTSLPKEFHDRLAKHSVLGGAKAIVASTYAEQVSATKTRLFIVATCTLDDESPSSTGATPLERPTRLLIQLTKGLAQIEQIVTRRRLGFQSFVFLTNTLATRRATSCKVCDKPFGLVRLDHHVCQLCGFRTCASCSAVHAVETAPGVVRMNRVCMGCLDAVHHCVFDDDDLALLGSSPIADVAISTGPSFAQRQAELPSAIRRVVIQRRRPQSHTDDDALKLVEFLFSSDTAKRAMAMDRFGGTSSPSERVHPSLHLLKGLLELVLTQPLRLPVAECGYAEANCTREYVLHFEDGLRIADAPSIPHEHIRLELLTRLGLLDADRFVSDPFTVVCEIAARVMDCRTAFVSVVGPDLQYAVAHFNLSLRKLPRRETMCAYALTSSRPFIVRNARHDLRFREFFCVARGGFQFYASFPIAAPPSASPGGTSTAAGGIVASLVVVDREPKRVVTNRQYARMVMLTRVLTDLLGAIPLGGRNP